MVFVICNCLFSLGMGSVAFDNYDFHFGFFCPFRLSVLDQLFLLRPKDCLELSM